MTTKPRRTAADTADALRRAVPAHLRARLQEAFEPFMQAVLDAALGVRHVYAQDPTTQQWARVTDPDTITALLNATPDHRDTVESVLVIYTQDPDGPLLETLLAFHLGPPFDPDRVPALTQALLEAGPEPDLVAQVARLDAAFRASRPADRPRPSNRRLRIQ